MTSKLPRMFRVYRKGKPYVHLGNVEAPTASEALERAVKGVWKGYFALPGDQPSSIDNLVAME